MRFIPIGAIAYRSKRSLQDSVKLADPRSDKRKDPHFLAAITCSLFLAGQRADPDWNSITTTLPSGSVHESSNASFNNESLFNNNTYQLEVSETIKNT